MKRPANGSTPKQYAYATRLLNGGEGAQSKKEIARSVGFSPSVANNVKNKIENTVGYHNAMHKLAQESNNLMLSILSEFQTRGLNTFDNKELLTAVGIIGNAWEKFNKSDEPDKGKNDVNPLKQVIMKRRIIQTETVVADKPEEVESNIVDVEVGEENPTETIPEEVDLDF